ncbi:MAG: pyridoxamine 5'-phosphate oxidase family protein [Tissierellia bacterium]|nr:pyridoxamine 5'-phosphate oxidase family protein [Tissierellia bacterium]
MRRKDREVKEINELLQIIEECKVLRIALKDDNGLYIVPLNYGYSYENNQLTLFFHSAKEGRKINALKINNDIAFEMDCNHALMEGNVACDYGFKFKSIIGNGKSIEIENNEEKKNALSILMKHQTGKEFIFDDNMIRNISVFKIIVYNFSGKSCK